MRPGTTGFTGPSGRRRRTICCSRLLDTMNAVRRTVTWGRLRANRERPAPDHHSFAEHDAIVDAIEDRDRNRARDAMRAHLLNVERKLLAS